MLLFLSRGDGNRDGDADADTDAGGDGDADARMGGGNPHPTFVSVPAFVGGGGARGGVGKTSSTHRLSPSLDRLP